MVLNSDMSKDYTPWPNYSEEEGQIVKEVLLSNRVNYLHGAVGRKFESKFSMLCQCEHSIALANGTLAIDIALVALGIGEGDEVIVTPRSFMASASAIHNSRARPVFADVDLDSQNITAESVAAVISDRTRAILCVHLAGWPCDLDPIMELVDGKNIAVIEDCAQAHGAQYRGRPVGALGDIGAWSFCTDKIMTTGGEGGMVTTNSAEHYETMWAYKDHGKNRTKIETPSRDRGFKYVHDSFGSNFRLTEMQSAIGLYQLGLLPQWTEQRNRNAMQYHTALADMDVVRSPLPESDIVHAYYKYYLFLNLHVLKANWDRDRVMREVNSKGGNILSGSCPELYMEQAFISEYGSQKQRPNAARLGTESLMLVVHPSLTSEYIDFNIEVLTTVLHDVTK